MNTLSEFRKKEQLTKEKHPRNTTNKTVLQNGFGHDTLIHILKMYIPCNNGIREQRPEEC